MFQAGESCALPTPAPRAALRDMRFHYETPDGEQHLAHGMEALLDEVAPGQAWRRDLAFMCIGTDRSTGDALGPLVGTFLLEKGVAAHRVWGTLDKPVHATNLTTALADMNRSFPRSTVIAVDACLGRAENVGVIAFGAGPLRPGAGVHKTLPPVGCVYLTGTVNVGGFMEYFVLQNTRLALVVGMAKAIAGGLAQLPGTREPEPLEAAVLETTVQGAEKLSAGQTSAGPRPYGASAAGG